MRVTLACVATLLLVACADGDDKRPPEMAPITSGSEEGGAQGASDRFVLSNLRLPGGARVEMRIDGATIVEVGTRLAGSSERRVDGAGRFVVPGYIDSHVHLSYYPVALRLPARGLVAAVDLAAPLAGFDEATGDLDLLRAGPMLTAPLGYPTQTWGSNGYGWELQNEAQAADAVIQLDKQGARVIKLAITSEPTLTDPQIEAIVESARKQELPTVAHALGKAEVERAMRLGVEILAHTPTETLPDELVQGLAGRTVISTLAAFGGGAPAVTNLRRLREAGVLVLYGTDLGNLTNVGISGSELSLLAEAGLDPAEILASLTRDPARVWGLTELGTIAPGKLASFVLLDADPLVDPQALVEPARVYVRGRVVATP